MQKRSFKEEITILSVAKPWSMADDNNKVYNTGCTMWYCNTPDIYQKNFDDDTQTVGHAPIKQTMPAEFHAYVKEFGLPCKAVGEFVMRNKGTGIAVVLSGVEFPELSKTVSVSETPDEPVEKEPGTKKK